MAQDRSSRSRQTDEHLNEGACEYLADMILEAQQLALRLGAASVSTQLQMAYLETEVLRRGLTHSVPRTQQAS